MTKTIKNHNNEPEFDKNIDKIENKIPKSPKVQNLSISSLDNTFEITRKAKINFRLMDERCRILKKDAKNSNFH